jgi:hypothetical protein
MKKNEKYGINFLKLIKFINKYNFKIKIYFFGISINNNI